MVFPYNALVPPNEPWPWPDAKATAKAFLDQIGVDDDPGLGEFVGDGAAALAGDQQVDVAAELRGGGHRVQRRGIEDGVVVLH